VPLEVTLLGTGSPLPDANRAGPSTLVRAAGHTFLFDCGRGVLMRCAAAGVNPAQFDAVLLTHLHSDHVTDLNDVITTAWTRQFAPENIVLFGPPGTAELAERTLAMLARDIEWRREHHGDLEWDPRVDVHEVSAGAVLEAGGVEIRAAPTEHKPVHPTVGYRIETSDGAVVIAGDTVPCAGLDDLCAGADVYVQTVVRRDIIEAMRVPRLMDVLDYHSDLEDAGRTASRAGVRTLVLTHQAPPPFPGSEDEWIAQAARHFDGEIVFGEDLLTVAV
jgi:ribonuclease Z